ncbi:probable calcium-binding protein CML25 [Magnolia sinica]|uniref:probable calcium-binding protein CML25 n=1 Tax=Magnolia sinica TaxID=86752 RepID=UPI00265A7E05|nr:probable calcium-binding protein CML25 [Magnolia sinica]
MSNLGHPASEEELQRMVRQVNFDGNGFIDLNEFIELNTTDVDSSTILEDLWNAFLIFNLEGNGSISPEELQRVLQSLGDESSMAECRKMISGVDCDGSGLEAAVVFLLDVAERRGREGRERERESEKTGANAGRVLGFCLAVKLGRGGKKLGRDVSNSWAWTIAQEEE